MAEQAIPETVIAALAAVREGGKVNIPPLDVSFWARVEICGRCWVWTGYCMPAPHYYGQMRRKGRTYLAHRYAWMQLHGAITDDVKVLHHCDNPPCISPFCLFIGNQGINMQDMAAKRRQWKQRRAECTNGHPYTAENSMPARRGTRRCRTCYVAALRRAKPLRPRVRPTHCPQGHPYDEGNTLIRADGQRDCRTCSRERTRRRRAHG